MLFCWIKFANAFAVAPEKGDIIINELMWMGMEGSTSDEWIELKNTTDKPIALTMCRLFKSSGADIVKNADIYRDTIAPHAYYLVSYKTQQDSKIDIATNKVLSYLALSNTELKVTLQCAGQIIDVAGDGAVPLEGENAVIKKSMERNLIPADGTKKENWHTCYEVKNLKENSIDCATPGAENSIKEKEKPQPKKEYPVGMAITELFPNPFESQYEEYIEIFNGSEKEVDLSGWSLHDASKSGKYVFKESLILKAKEYLAIFKNSFKFALNNSGNEKVSLLDPDGIEISSVAYNGSKKNLSYNFDGSRWRWSKFMTPGAENILNNEPYGKIKISKKIYADVFADFSISTVDKDNDKIKVVWEFGDRHKSSLKKTRHKYSETGNYSGSIKLFDGSEEIIKNFDVQVQRYPESNMKIIKINPNPKGSDTFNEAITVENRSKKKINLKDWSIATGLKKMINHPIKKDLFVEKDKSVEITRSVSSFSLNNKSSKVELRYPNGKVASRVKYESINKSIAEGEMYVKTKNGWSWLQVKQTTITKKQETNNIQNPIINEQDKGESENNKKNVVTKTIVPVKIEKEIELLEVNKDFVKIELLKGKVLGVENIRESDERYLFTPLSEEDEHWVVVILSGVFRDINTEINLALNYFFK